MAEEPTARAKWLHTLSAPVGLEDATPLSSSVRVEFGARSHRGMLQPHHEDHYLVLQLSRHQRTLMTSLSSADVASRFDEYGYAMAVADGLGGTGAGAVASRTALSALVHLVMHFGRWNVRIDSQLAAQLLKRAEWYYDQIDRIVVRKGGRQPALAGMATAMTTTFSAGDHLFVAHVGHSRAYLYREGQLTQLTRDQTIRQQLADTRRPAAVEPGIQDLEHLLTDAIGGATAPSVAVDHYRLRDDDWLLLCTDGLTAVVEDDRIAELLALRRKPDDTCQMLVDLTLERGGHDNVTVVLAHYEIPPSSSVTEERDPYEAVDGKRSGLSSVGGSST